MHIHHFLQLNSLTVWKTPSIVLPVTKADTAVAEDMKSGCGGGYEGGHGGRGGGHEGGRGRRRGGGY
ncbi:hypothetical protein RHMOL_Rhmol06G0238900 [Rhododendron molle]|uniref:Uncharacterized protein n=1 Tax=Rhododendron molle TaxID=49168 RepID=A0ACC0NFX6_RHOML|nr:hypothetical protein RHMOL_Rhmol06G0238900 [Rhododendron molle]